MSIAPLLAIVMEWAKSRADVLALALIGSHARAAAHDGSDVDLLLLVLDPAGFRADAAWLAEIQWSCGGLSVAGWRDATYGAVWSRHVTFADGSEIEFSFGAASWADISPVDPGTRRVVDDGWRVLLDRRGLLATLAAHAT